MGRVKTYDETLRRGLLDQAGVLLSEEGLGALTLRRVASAAGTSTTAVYSLFGDKDQLLATMYSEGFLRLGASLRRARVGEPLEALAGMGVAYRRSALARPQLYALMFSRTAPSDDTRQLADAAHLPLVEGVQACLDSGALQGGTAESIAALLWAVAHGFVSLELAGLVAGTARARDLAYRDALVRSTVSFLG